MLESFIYYILRKFVKDYINLFLILIAGISSILSIWFKNIENFPAWTLYTLIVSLLIIISIRICFITYKAFYQSSKTLKIVEKERDDSQKSMLNLVNQIEEHKLLYARLLLKTVYEGLVEKCEILLRLKSINKIESKIAEIRMIDGKELLIVLAVGEDDGYFENLEISLVKRDSVEIPLGTATITQVQKKISVAKLIDQNTTFWNGIRNQISASGAPLKNRSIIARLEIPRYLRELTDDEIKKILIFLKNEFVLKGA